MSLDLRRVPIVLFLALGLPALAGCGGGGDAERESEAAERAEEEADLPAGMRGMAEAARQMEEAARAMEEGRTVEPVDFRRLRDLLPERLAGMQRTDVSGERSGAMGFTVSRAEADYRPEDEESSASLNVEVMDLAGTMGGMGIASMAGWLSVQVDRETADGYERTTRLDGHPAYEEFTRSEDDRGSARLQVVVARRFLVNVQGYHVTMESARDAARSLDLDALAALAAEES